jgi:hypothetical protein
LYSMRLWVREHVYVSRDGLVLIELSILRNVTQNVTHALDRPTRIV